MIRKFALICIVTVLLMASVACSKRNSTPRLQVEIPAAFSGNCVLEMGINDASPLAKDGDDYVLSVPRDGKVRTSTLLNNPKVTFKNGSNGQVWGYSQRIFTTGDGISVGGKIEFFVGTQKEFEAEQNKKNKSGGFLKLEPAFARA
jgi:hypothetical protein